MCWPRLEGHKGDLIKEERETIFFNNKMKQQQHT